MPCETAGVVSRLSTYQEGIETPTGYHLFSGIKVSFKDA